MNTKRILCVLLCACMLLCLAACRKDPPQPSETFAATEDPAPVESSAAAESQATTERPENEDEADSDEIKILHLEKTLHTYLEWEEDFVYDLVQSNHAYVTLAEEDAVAFPEMAEVLAQIGTMQENAMLDEFDNLVSLAREKLNADRSGFETYVSKLDIQVRRADSLVISLLSDSYSHYGQIKNYRVLHGSNYDPQTGKALALNDVVDVNNNLAEAVEKELTGHMWTGEFYSDSTVEDYFANTPYDGFSWTLDYTGVTFYFAPGELCDEGAMTATVSFAEYPELFCEKYMVAPAEYTVELPMNISFFTELEDDDGDLEEISISAQLERERNHYIDYGVYTDTQYYSEDCFVYDFHPYYVKAASGDYLYLFCEDFDAGMRQMNLVVLSLNDDGSITKSGSANVSPAWLADNRFLVPTDPASLIFDDLDGGAEKTVFTVGSDGMPSA